MNELKEPQSESMTINSDLAQRIMDELGQNVYLCYQCVKCTSGCPLGAFFDWQPNQIMRATQLGQEDIAFNSDTPRLCASCQTCTTRCPQGLDIAAIMNFLTREAMARGYPPRVSEVEVFNQAFLREVRLWGRAYELGLMAEMNLRTRKLTNHLDLGIKMIRKGKVAFLPTKTRSPRNPRPLPGAKDAIAYYPGCSLHSTAREFNISSQEVCKAFGMKLMEPPGWVCCGSSAAHRADPDEALRLPMENLSLVERSGFTEVTMPCAACFNRHKAAQYELRHDSLRRAKVEKEIGYYYQDRVTVTSLVESLQAHVGPEKVAARVQRPLEGLRLVCYYGCLLTRPPQVTGASHPENPTDMDELMEALGAEVLDWSYKTVCCGAAHSLTRPDIVLQLSSGILEHAREAGAEALVVACPLCHTNLDARQFQMKLTEPLPVLFFTQLMALALGLGRKASAFHRNLVDPQPLLREKGFLE